MNRPPEQFQRIQADQLEAFSGACFKAAGLRPDHAELIAGLLTNSDVRGVPSHGNRAMPRYCRTLREGQVNPTPDLRVLKEIGQRDPRQRRSWSRLCSHDVGH